ncbi:MAG: 23S rRNA (guanosine(2251)-2'-O)-methyltransferase RlmB [Bacilli bacterium]|nr:23S rRNA (guanosine(2251)-2'-O)-methyltransferase RlmB [Bacilli bacterium]
MIVYGKNTIREGLKASNIEKLLTLDRFANDELVKMAKANKVRVEFVKEGDLAKISKTDSHQGFVAFSKEFGLSTVEEIIAAGKKEKYPLVLMLDGIEDPHNVGAILRSCDAFGVSGIVMKKRGEAPLNATVAKVSTGAINWVKVAQVSNLSQAIKTFKENGYWVVASDGTATQYYDEIDYKCPIVLIIGSEGFGISNLVLRNSDFIAKIPMVGHINSLNASVATAVFLSIVSVKRK